MDADNATAEPAPAPAASPEAPLFAYLASHDAPCPICGYNLRQLTRDVCPECGQRFHLSIGATRPPFAAFLMFLMPPLMVGGASLVMLAILAVLFARHQLGRGMPKVVWVLIALGLLDLVLAYFLYRRRVWFLRRPRTQRYACVAASWLVQIAAIALSLTFA